MKKMYGITLIISVALTLLFMLTMFRDWTLLALVNAVSMVSLLLIISGAALLVVGGGFFYGMAYSFRRFFKKTSKSWQLLDDIEKDEEFRPTTHSFSLTIPFLVVGAVLFIVTLGVSFLF